MVDYRSSRENEQDDIVETLLRIPVKNLEEKVKLFESEIKLRKKISWKAIAKLGTQQLHLEERMRHLNYSLGVQESFSRSLKFQFINLEIQKVREIISCFEDVSMKKEKLLIVNEELELERQKQRLIE